MGDEFAMAVPRVLFVHNSAMPMPFIATDMSLLRENFAVTELYVKGWHINPARILENVKCHDLVFAWFASRHSVLPLLFAKLLGKPSVLVIGGYDTACIPEINYGHQRGGIQKWISRLTLSCASRLITHATSSLEESIQNIGINENDLTVVYLGLDHLLYQPELVKEPMAVTVGNVDTSNLLRKGMESFVRAAHYLPDVAFALIGPWLDEAGDYLCRIAPPNVKVTGFLTKKELIAYLARAKVYVQASVHEGFGVANAEAMLCGCIPVVTRAGALPEVVGDTGVYLTSNSPEAIAEGIRTALSMNEDSGRRARERIVKEFPLEKRRKHLADLIDSLTGYRR